VARYNLVPCTIWSDGALSDLPSPPCCQATVYLYLVTCERPTCIPGLLRLGVGGIVDETGWDYESVESALSDLEARGLIVLSQRPAVIFVPEAARTDPPRGPKQRKGWESAIDALPACPPVEYARGMLSGSDTLPDTLSGTPSIPSPSPSTSTSPSPGSRVRADEEEDRRLEESFPSKPGSGWDWHAAWTGLGGRGHSPPPLQVARWLGLASYADASTACRSEVEALVGEAAGRDHPVSWLLACLDDSGRPKPKPASRGKPGNGAADLDTPEMAAWREDFNRRQAEMAKDYYRKD
jgi:hypothetical protein